VSRTVAPHQFGRMTYGRAMIHLLRVSVARATRKSWPHILSPGGEENVEPSLRRTNRKKRCSGHAPTGVAVIGVSHSISLQPHVRFADVVGGGELGGGPEALMRPTSSR